VTGLSDEVHPSLRSSHRTRIRLTFISRVRPSTATFHGRFFQIEKKRQLESSRSHRPAGKITRLLLLVYSFKFGSAFLYAIYLRRLSLGNGRPSQHLLSSFPPVTYMTLTSERNLEVNHHANYLGQRSHSSNVIAHTHTHTHTADRLLYLNH